MSVASAAVSDTNVLSEDEERRALGEERTDTNPNQTSELGRSYQRSESSFGLIYRKWPEFSGKRGENFESWMHQVNSFLGQAVFRHYSEPEKANSLKLSIVGTARNILEAEKESVMTVRGIFEVLRQNLWS